MLKTWKQWFAFVSVFLMARTVIIDYRDEHEHCETAREFEPTNNRIETEIRPHYTGTIAVTLPSMSGNRGIA